MAPIRTHDKTQPQASSSKVGSSAKKLPRTHQPKSSEVPGVQKIKSALRQTRRLLAKDNLAADVRVESERRLKALEADMARAELARKERAYATKYHKVKFFDRKKVLRKLKQAKKNAVSEAGSSNKIQDEIYELRMDLNYIIHYPKTKKYISLFPPEKRTDEATVVSEADKVKTDKCREEIRNWIRECMENGELSNEPELNLNTEQQQPQKKLQNDRWGAKDGKKTNSTEKAASKSAHEGDEDIAEDEFFGDDNESESD
ncbi:hypothetical protein BDQ17DRAFT_1232590 [Cyathus striatus]|nr:hypothetical protein BDQ17DRAFT_1232590 [Cyathus striatus]